MKETICVRLEYELINKLGLDKAKNRSDYLREILREYVRLKEKEKTYLEVGEKITALSEGLNPIKTTLEDIKKAIGKYEVEKKTKDGKKKVETIPVVNLVSSIPTELRDINERVSNLEQSFGNTYSNLLLAVILAIVIQLITLFLVLGIVFKLS